MRPPPDPHATPSAPTSASSSCQVTHESSPEPHERHEFPVSAPARPARSRLHHAGQPRADGLDAHGPGGGVRWFRADGRVLRGARPRRGGAHRHGRHRAELRRTGRAAGRAAVVSLAGRQAPDHHRRGPCGRRQDRHADPAYRTIRVSPAVGRAVGHPVADHAVQAARAHPLGHREDDRRLRPLRAARAEGRLRRRRDHGVGRLPDQRVRRAAHQPSQRRMGRDVREPHPLSRRDRAPHARGGRPELHHRLPAVDARSRRRRQHLGGGRRAGQGRRGGGRHDHQHRHRLARGARADDRDHGAARGVRVGDEAVEG